jgi:SseB protein N-terminal domain
VSGHLNPAGQQFRGDRGGADPLLTAALAAYHVGQGSEQAALGALAAARLLVPVIAEQSHKDQSDKDQSDKDQSDKDQSDKDQSDKDQSHKDQGDKDTEMVLPTLIGRDGRPAVLAFTGLDALARWRPDARPVPAEADRVWRAAVADGCAVVIDVAGPVPLAVEGARLAALAAGQPVPPPQEDPDVRAEVQAVVAAEPAIAGFSLAPGHSGTADLAITLHLAPRQDADRGPAVNRAAAGIATRLGARLRRGIEVVIAE